MTFDSSSNTMNVNLTWTTALNQSVFENYVVLWRIAYDDFHLPLENETSKTNMMLKLEVDTEYMLRVRINQLFCVNYFMFSA